MGRVGITGRVHPATALAVASLLLLLLAPSPATAQGLLVRVSDAESGEPLQGAVVTALQAGAPGGRGVAASALSDAAGRARMPGLPPGIYGVRAEMIGYATALREGAEATEGEPAVVSLSLSSRAIELEGLSVEGEERCRVRPEDGLRVAEVWDEVRKALEATRRTEEAGGYVYRVRQYARDVEERTGRVANQQSHARTLYTATPYRSRPAEQLVGEGFVQAAEDAQGGDLYFAPDAAVMLSDVFLDTHCVRLRTGEEERAGQVGLVFEPVSGRRLPDVAGTLWVDPQSWELEHLAYRYVNLDSRTALRDVGGDIAFQRLPDGTWIIPRWEIRMPWMAIQPDGRGGRRVYQHGIRQEGADVLSVQVQGGPVLLTAETATVEGVVLEEVSGEPVGEALVALAGTDRETLTDADGRFRFAEVLPGRYELTVEHAASAGLGASPEPRPVEAEEGVVQAVTLRVPSELSAVARACREEAPDRPAEAAALVGQVLDGGSGVPLEGAEVTVRWEGWTVEGGGAGTVQVGQAGEGVRATTGPEGRYRVCAVPRDTRLTVTARWGPFETPGDELRIPGGQAVWNHDVAVGVGARTLVAGRVTGYQGGEVVAGAEVRLTALGSDGDDGGGDGRPRVVTTDAEGAFRLPDAQVGRYEVVVSSLGYQDVTDTVVAAGGRLNQVTVRLPEEALAIEGVTVEVEARLERLDRAGFYERRERGPGGVFLDREEIEDTPVSRPQELFRNRPGVQVRYTTGETGSRAALTNGRCMPAVYVDGSLVRRAQSFDEDPNRAVLYLDDLIPMDAIDGIEFFRDPAEIPVQYGGTGANCGVVLVWTR